MNKENKEKYYREEFERYHTLPLEQVIKMNASRCLAYYKKFRDFYPIWNSYDQQRDVNPILKEYIKQVKEILESKPHVERKPTVKTKKEKKDNRK
jgi:hypothetical protein